VVYILVTLVGVVLVSELLLFAATSLHDGTLRFASSWQSQRDELINRFTPTGPLDATPQRQYGATAEDVLHPYVGFVTDPARAAAHELGFRTEAIDPIQKRSPQKLLIAVLGGSVAEGYGHLGQELLAQHLGDHRELGHRQIMVINLAMGGYKQPQQLMVLNYLLILGAEFDFAINIDGFNEVALHEFENAHWGVCPAFPRVWPLFVDPVPDPYLLESLGRREWLQMRMADLARDHSVAPLRYAMLWNVLWDVRHRRLAAEHAKVISSVVERQKRAEALLTTTEQPYRVTGPTRSFTDRGQMYRHLAGLWRESSVQLDRLCRARGIRYLHFLQPNQYVAGSKPMGPEERRIAINTQHFYKWCVEAGYPMLIEEGRRLAERGVAFTDLTRIFADVSEPLYHDDCCHFSEAGYEIMAGHIAEAITAAW
jgi:hypothetical protein